MARRAETLNPSRTDPRALAGMAAKAAQRRIDDPEWAARMDAIREANEHEAARDRAVSAAWEAAGRPMDEAEFERLVTVPLREAGWDL